MDNFKQAVQKISRLSDSSMQQLIGICNTRRFKKNEFVLNTGSICNGMYFVSKGLLRIYYLKDNKEISEWFAFENSFCFSIISYFKNTPSTLIIQCIEESDVITLSRDGLTNLKQKNLEIAGFAYDLLSRSLIASQERMAGIQFETADQRYRNLLTLHTNMVQRIPLHHIASYLGVSAETLSRIRKRVH